MILGSSNLIPPKPPVKEQRPVEEIVGTVRPIRKSGFAHNATTVVAILLVVGAMGYFVYGNLPEISTPIKVANAPEVTPRGEPYPTSTSVPVIIQPITEPTVTPVPNSVGEAEPRISSIATTVPNTPTPTVAAATTPATKKYIDASGFSVTLPYTALVKSTIGAGKTITFWNAQGKLLATVEVGDSLLDTPDGLGRQLMLSPSLTDIQATTFQNYNAYRYTVNGSASGIAIIAGSHVYYVTDYTKMFIQSLVIR